MSTAVKGVWIALCVGSAAFLLRLHFWTERNAPPAELIDDRYRELLPLLPPAPVLRYLSDQSGGDQHMKAVYALAPHLLVDPRIEARWGVADLSDGKLLEPFARQVGMRPVAVFRGGQVALLEAIH